MLNKVFYTTDRTCILLDMRIHFSIDASIYFPCLSNHKCIKIYYSTTYTIREHFQLKPREMFGYNPGTYNLWRCICNYSRLIDIIN